MRLADSYTQDELPTRPDNPRTAARRCKHCGQVAGDHVVTRPGTRTAPASATMLRAGCMGLRRNFDPETQGEADHER